VRAICGMTVRHGMPVSDDDWLADQLQTFITHRSVPNRSGERGASGSIGGSGGNGEGRFLDGRRERR